jgi:hypothetical protein
MKHPKMSPGLRSIKQPTVITLNQRTAVTGGIALAGNLPAPERRHCASDDNRATTRSVTYTGYLSTPDRDAVCAANNSPRPVHGADMVMAYKNNWTHKIPRRYCPAA